MGLPGPAQSRTAGKQERRPALKIAAIRDIHCRVNNDEMTRSVLDGIPEKADVLVLAGDLTDNGLPASCSKQFSGVPYCLFEL
jgi:hypothetical protein